jgi:hypothetical protein
MLSYVAAMLYAHVLRDHAPPSPPITISIDAFKAYVKELGVIDMIGEEEVEPYLSMLAKLGLGECRIFPHVCRLLRTCCSLVLGDDNM